MMVLHPVIRHFLIPNKRTLVFAIKGILSMVLALLISMNLELDRPFWAVFASMLLQARPESGLVIEKALLFVVAAIVGGAFSILIISNFSYYPVLSLGFLTLFVGVASYLSGYVQHSNYNYFFAITGITAPIIVIVVMSNAETVTSLEVFEVVRSRISEAMVGAFCAALVSIFFVPLKLKDLLQLHAEKTLCSLFTLVHTELTDNSDEHVSYRRANEFLASISQLNHDSKSSWYDGPEGSLRSRACYFVCKESIEILSISQSLSFQLKNNNKDLSKCLLNILHSVGDEYFKIAMTSDNSCRLDLLKSMHRSICFHKLSGAIMNHKDLIMIKKIINLLMLTSKIIRITDDIKHCRVKKIKHQRLRIHQDYLILCLGAVRSMIVFSCGAAIWIGTGSSITVQMMMTLPTFFSMSFSAISNSEVLVKKVTYGAFLAIPVAVFAELSLLSAGSGNVEILLLIMSSPLFVALMAISWPPTMPYGLGAALSFVFLIQPSNSMTFSADESISSGLSLIVGLCILYSVFYVLKNPDNKFTHERNIRSLSVDYRRFYSGKIKNVDLLNYISGKLIALKNSSSNTDSLLAIRNVFLLRNALLLKRYNIDMMTEELCAWFENYFKIIFSNDDHIKINLVRSGSEIKESLYKKLSTMSASDLDKTEDSIFILSYAIKNLLDSTNNR